MIRGLLKLGNVVVMEGRKYKLAIVGCGAISEQLHMPSLARRDDCEIFALVDTNAARIDVLAKQFGATHTFTNFEALLDIDIDAAIIAAPNNVHAEMTVKLLNAGVHVLVEKPMAMNAAECEHMQAAADSAGKVLAVGHILRFAQTARFAKWAIDSGMLGRIDSFDIRYGFVFAWPTASDYFLRKELSGGGVLIDLGAHSIDLLLWWLGDVASFDYYDDSHGGVEADCLLEATLESGAKGTLELSRTRNLRSTAIIRGDKAELEVAFAENSVSLRYNDGGMGIAGQAMLDGEAPNPLQRTSDLVIAEHEDFLAAIKNDRPALVSGTEASRCMQLIDACYAARRPLELPWTEVNTQPSWRAAK